MRLTIKLQPSLFLDCLSFQAANLERWTGIEPACVAQGNPHNARRAAGYTRSAIHRMIMPVSPGCPANRAKRALRLVTRTRTMNPDNITPLLFRVASRTGGRSAWWRAALVGMVGIEPAPFPVCSYSAMLLTVAFCH